MIGRLHQEVDRLQKELASTKAQKKANQTALIEVFYPSLFYFFILLCSIFFIIG